MMINKTGILALTYLGVVLSWQPVLADTVYYLDGSSGHDSNAGTSPNNPWRSLAKLQGIELKPGDKILLKASCQFAGRLRPKGSGVDGSPIVIDRYGEGANPVVAGEGKVENTIRLHNQHHWEIRNLTVANTDGGDWTDAGRAIRRAVHITAEDAGDVAHIHLRNLDIRDVRGMCRFKGHEANGGLSARLWARGRRLGSSI